MAKPARTVAIAEEATLWPGAQVTHVAFDVVDRLRGQMPGGLCDVLVVAVPAGEGEAMKQAILEPDPAPDFERIADPRLGR